MIGESDRAAKLFQNLLAERPDDFDASFALAFLLREVGQPAAAADALLQAAEQPGLALEQLLQIAQFLRDSNQIAAAIKVREKAVELSPGQADLYYELGRLYQATSDFDRSLDAFLKTLELEPQLGPAWTALAQQKKFHSIDDTVFSKIEAAASQSLGDEADMCVAFAFGKALDDLQQWPEAWRQFQKGNVLASSKMQWNPDAWSEFVERTNSKSFLLDHPAEDANRHPVFIVGMPRSGTTLLERLLDRHPGISGRGELNFLDEVVKQRSDAGALSEAERQAIRDLLWTQMKLDGPDDEIYIDKNPLNFRYLGTLFDLFPTASVLHITRDGRDACLSCYLQLFQHPDLAFSYSLDHLVEFYSGYRRLMARWLALYADRIHEVRYENLVNSSESALAKILDFLGAESRDPVTESTQRVHVVRSASVWQSRQPIYESSIERWRHYEDQAPGFFRAVHAIDNHYESGKR